MCSSHCRINHVVISMSSGSKPRSRISGRMSEEEENEEKAEPEEGSLTE